MRFIKTTAVSALVLFSILAGTLYGQSDYDKFQNFKTRFSQLESAIKNAASLEECRIISENLVKLKKDFAGDKILLDKSLYPENFESSFARAEKALEVRKGDFKQIVELKTEVGSLQDQVSELSQKNEGLIVQIKQLQIQSTKDAATIASLQSLVSQLKSNIAQRDELVRGIIDSLLAKFVKNPNTLNEAEKQAIFKKVDNGNLFYNIERTISDNIQFMKVTQMTPEDYSNMRKQYTDFSKTWQQIGPKLGNVYLTKRDKAAQVENINSMFGEWGVKINDEIWGQVNKLFRDKKLSVLPFRSGEQFVNSVKAFVNDEIKNYGVKSSAESKNTFNSFTDSVYFRTVQPVWIPILRENRMMSDANKDSVEKTLKFWKEKVAPGSSNNWIFFVLGFIIIALIALLMMRKKKVVVVQSAPPSGE